MTLEDHARLVKAHDDRCAICRRPETRTNRLGVTLIALDHDHKTGEVRGLLCHNCNTGIGRFNDDPELLLAAVAYLRGERRFKP
jgi:hypothetical protein